MVTKKKKGHLPMKKNCGEFLSCQGYACKYFCSEEEWRNLDKRLIPLNGDPDLLVDRYDIRLMLTDVDCLLKKRSYTPGEIAKLRDESPALDKERYQDLPRSNLFEDEVLDRMTGDRRYQPSLSSSSSSSSSSPRGTAASRQDKKFHSFKTSRSQDEEEAQQEEEESLSPGVEEVDLGERRTDERRRRRGRDVGWTPTRDELEKKTRRERRSEERDSRGLGTREYHTKKDRKREESDASYYEARS
ncbi:splicing arginine serine-rich protein, partial [Cystoisospora suis]